MRKLLFVIAITYSSNLFAQTCQKDTVHSSDQPSAQFWSVLKTDVKNCPYKKLDRGGEYVYVIQYPDGKVVQLNDNTDITPDEYEWRMSVIREYNEVLLGKVRELLGEKKKLSKEEMNRLYDFILNNISTSRSGLEQMAAYLKKKSLNKEVYTSGVYMETILKAYKDNLELLKKD